jgi:hypothetical protein
VAEDGVVSETSGIVPASMGFRVRHFFSTLPFLQHKLETLVLKYTFTLQAYAARVDCSVPCHSMAHSIMIIHGPH